MRTKNLNSYDYNIYSSNNIFIDDVQTIDD